MKNHSEPSDELTELREKLAGLGERSVRKTYYPELQHRLEELERFKAFIDHSNDAMFLASVPMGQIVDVNHSACRQMGWSREEFLQLSLFDVSQLHNCPAADLLISDALEQSEERALVVTELRTKHGDAFTAELTLNRMVFNDGTYVLAVARDITERRRSEEALRQSEDFLRNIVDNIPALVFAKEPPEFRYVELNKASEELLGFSRDEMLGRSDRDFFPLEQAAYFTQKDREVIEKGELVEIPEETVKTRLGGDRIIRTKKIPLFDRNGNARYLLGIAEDITDRKRLEQQLLHSQKMDAIGQLAGGVAHDFNNILMVIMGYCATFDREGALNPEQKRKLEKIMEASEKASRLTKSLLTFSRKEPVRLRAASLNDLVRDIHGFLARIIGEDMQLKSVLSEKNLLVKVDTGQIEQVLVNLATNARDAMPKGGVLTIETSIQVIAPVTEPGSTPGELGHYAVIAVSDTGIGMDAKTRDRIFEPFFTTKEPGKGTGLGMAIVYGIVKQHNGFINVYSEPNAGTTFRVYLPLLDKGCSVARDAAGEAPRRGNMETILLAEDEDSVRELMEEVLTTNGYKVIVAVDGMDAVAKFQSHRERISLILMDMIMPRMNGRQACEAIRKFGSDVKVIYTSGYTMEAIQSRDLLDEGVELVMKPIQPLELLRKVREALDKIDDMVVGSS